MFVYKKGPSFPMLAVTVLGLSCFLVLLEVSSLKRVHFFLAEVVAISKVEQFAAQAGLLKFLPAHLATKFVSFLQDKHH